MESIFNMHMPANTKGPNKKISVFQIMGRKILGRVGTYIFLTISFF